LQHQTKRNARCNIRTNSTATLEQSYCNNRTKVLQREMQDQKKETNATKKYYSLQKKEQKAKVRNQTSEKKLMQQ
jgi:hypothetical protein